MGDPSVVPRLRPLPGPRDFLVGFVLPFRAFALIRRSRMLTALSVICAVITLASLVGLVFLLWKTTPALMAAMLGRPEGWLGRALWEVGQALLFIVLLLAGANTVPLLLNAPFQDAMSEETESLCGDFTSPPFRPGTFLRGLWVSLTHTLARVALLLAGHALLLPLNFLPGLGSVAWTVLGGLWTVVWIAAEHVGAPMARHFHRFGEVTRVLRRRKALTLGFGAATAGLLWVPLVNALLVPLAIVGGTLLYRALVDAGEIVPSARERAGAAGR